MSLYKKIRDYFYKCLPYHLSNGKLEPGGKVIVDSLIMAIAQVMEEEIQKLKEKQE